MRFPECQHPVENVAKLACRRAIFEGNTECPYGDNADCVACWKKPYAGDIDTNFGTTQRTTNSADDNFDEDATIRAMLGR